MKNNFFGALVATTTVAATLCTSAFVNADVSMYRLYNPNSGEHFYTANPSEKFNLVSLGWQDEGTGWIAPDTGSPVYRLYNKTAGDHFYTSSSFERDSLVAAGWNDEGIGWYSGGSVPLYRDYNPNATSGSHNYTTNLAEAQHLVSVGWSDEGIGWYGIGAGVPAPTTNTTLSAADDYTQNYAQKLTGTADSTVESAIAHGLSYIGKSPYSWGGGRTSESIAANQFDCSSFVAWMYASAGHPIDNQPTVTTNSLWKVGTTVNWSDLKRGDLIIFNAPATNNALVQTTIYGQVLYNQPAEVDSHVVIYLGDGFFLHDSPASPTGGVGINRMSDVEKDQQYFANETWQQLIQNSQYTIQRVG